MEKIIKDKVTQYLEKNNIIIDSQHGFKSNRSCLINPLDFMEYVPRYADQRDSIDITFLDLNKAFDKVSHRRLLDKIKATGIKGRILEWIREWLRDRKQGLVRN